jgi:hypothetical protein
MPIKCPNCENKIIHTNLNNSICNPYVGRYKRKTCRKIIYLRKNTFCNFFPHIPFTIIIKVIYESICNNNNEYIICSKIESKYNIKSMRYQTILKILEKLREVICHVLYDIYKIEPISTKNAHEYFIVDESEFISLSHKQI